MRLAGQLVANPYHRLTDANRRLTWQHYRCAVPFVEPHRQSCRLVRGRALRGRSASFVISSLRGSSLGLRLEKASGSTVIPDSFASFATLRRVPVTTRRALRPHARVPVLPGAPLLPARPPSSPALHPRGA